MITPLPVASFLGVWTCWRREPLPWLGFPKKPNGSKNPPNGSSWTSTVFVLEFCTYLMWTTAGRAFSAAYVRSTGWPGATTGASAAYTLMKAPVEKARAVTQAAPAKYFDKFFIFLIICSLITFICVKPSLFVNVSLTYSQMQI